VKKPPPRNNPEKKQPIHQKSTLSLVKRTQNTFQESTELHKTKRKARLKRRGKQTRKTLLRAPKTHN